MADRGGDSELSTLECSYIRKLADTEIVIRLLTSDIARRGLFRPSGAVRDVHDKLMTALATFDRLAQRIGLARRPRRVNILDQIADARAEAERQRAAPPAAPEPPQDDQPDAPEAQGDPCND